jgi:hypothetical protein
MGGIYGGALRLPSGDFTSLNGEAAKHLLMTQHHSSRRVLQDPAQEDWEPAQEDWEPASEVVSEDKVRWAIDGFGTIKAAGEDGILPGLLQHGIEIIIGHITNIFAACLAYGYIPLAWRAVRVIFIPKAGRDSNGLAESFRFMSLDIFLFENDGIARGFFYKCGTVKILPACGIIPVCIPEKQIH